MKKIVPFTRDGIVRVSANKPVVYKVRNGQGENVYTGSAKRGRVRRRLVEHLPGGPAPIPGGRTVEVLPVSSIDEARTRESNIIARSKPRHNKRGK